MKKPRLLPLTGILAILAGSCIDRDILNISDSLHLQPTYSLPIGVFDDNINPYLESLDTAAFPWPDSLYYNDVLYPNPLSAVKFSSLDTLTFNMLPGDNSGIRSIEFVLPVSNGYPVQVTLQVYLLSGGALLPVDSVFRNGPLVIPPATVDNGGIVLQSYNDVYSVDMPAEFIAELDRVDWIRVVGLVDTGQEGDRKPRFYSGYQVGIHVGMRIELLYDKEHK